MINDAELKAMQATQKTALTDEATISAETLISDGRGGKTATLTTRAAKVPMRVGTPNQRERTQISDRFRNESIYLATFPVGTIIEAGDRVMTSDGSTYDVLGVNEPETLNTAIRVIMRKFDG